MAKRRRSCRLCVGLSYSFPSGSVGEKRSRQLRGQARIRNRTLPENTEVVNLLYRALMTAGDANLRLGRMKDAYVKFEQCKNLVPTSVSALAGYAKSLCGVERQYEAQEVLLSLEKEGQQNTVEELTIIGAAWLYTDDREKGEYMARRVNM
eukprot:1176738-Prorocentrum_minimum.AAC.2